MGAVPPRPAPRLRQKRLRPPRLRGLPISRLLPNMLTMLNLASGMTGIRFAMEGKWKEAVLAIAVGALFDLLDGYIARMLNAQSKFGEELDSLSDVVSFGVAPAMILYLWALADARTFGWMAALVMGVCAALRLARFNTMLGAAEKPPFAYNYFTGVPAPAGAFLALLPLIATLEVGEGWFDSPVLVVPWTVGVAGLMISAIPTFSLKGLRIPQRYVVFLLLGVGMTAAAMVSAPWATLTVVGLAYLASIPFSAKRYRTLAMEAARLKGEPGEGETVAPEADTAASAGKAGPAV
ncbi:CDP-diacylglycerol--serine O-phosphatidyltransferase [Niveispirillum sp. BGYR6]|uniref:CDP-diacylglycerol--serine O-phosphatidyltransferase n=1 Tax=Niveispirillum sp. BGYR6 TaxID=2971249 RepID=UPI0022B9D05E|nr:CDP-diacylglycerol--serine O-phosphatidyltransferase [Niveispirillum sp. BGYR6]MDG5493503.1 CDP-diacylglycerol--serine O-phosphatidyltransferase [Niveispirillum sp. BGYR6]